MQQSPMVEILNLLEEWSDVKRPGVGSTIEEKYLLERSHIALKNYYRLIIAGLQEEATRKDERSKSLGFDCDFCGSPAVNQRKDELGVTNTCKRCCALIVVNAGNVKIDSLRIAEFSDKLRSIQGKNEMAFTALEARVAELEASNTNLRNRLNKGMKR